MVFSGSLNRRLGARVVVAQPNDWSSSLEFEIDLGGSAALSSRAVSIRPYLSDIASGSNASYDVRFYTIEGELLRRVTRAVQYPVRPGFAMVESNMGVRHNYGAVGAPIALPDGFFLVPVWWEEEITDPDYPVASIVHFFYPNGDFILGPIRVCTKNPRWPAPPRVGDEVLLFPQGIPPFPNLVRNAGGGSEFVSGNSLEVRLPAMLQEFEQFRWAINMDQLAQLVRPAVVGGS